MEITETRRARLKLWFSTHKIPHAQRSYISQLIKGKASFGEKAARRLEVAHEMGVGHLDKPIDDESVTTQGSAPPVYTKHMQAVIDLMLKLEAGDHGFVHKAVIEALKDLTPIEKDKKQKVAGQTGN